MKMNSDKIMAKVQEIQKRQDDSLRQAEQDYLKIKAERERLKKEAQEAAEKTDK